ncbi:AAA family ATPase [Virgibacillus profundi]|nr:AAA family ATPase [Virgibacillus profundi]
MNKVKIVLFTLDDTYAEYFSNYMRNPENGIKFSTKIYTDENAFRKNTRNQKQHILLTDLEIDTEETKNFDKVINLTGDQINQTEKELVIFKYQPLKELLSQVLAAYYEANGKLAAMVNGKQKETVISFYSGSAGSGKTLFSLCLAKHLAMQEKNVFYLNLEQLHTTYLFFKEEKESSVEVFYYLKNNVERLISKIELLKSRDSLTNIEYFSLPVLPEEMEIITSEQINILIQALKETQNYDYIIIDLDSSIHERNIAAMENSDEVFWVLNSDEASLAKSQYILDNDVLDINMDKTKIHYVLNKVGSSVFEGFNSYNFSIETHVPFNAHWLEISEQTKVLEDTLIGEQLSKLFEKNPDIFSEVAAVES